MTKIQKGIFDGQFFKTSCLRNDYIFGFAEETRLRDELGMNGIL